MAIQMYRFSKKEQTEMPDGVDPTEFLGGKGAGVRSMATNGLPVPPGFTLSTQLCMEYLSCTAKKKEEMLEYVIQGAMPQMNWLKKQFKYMPLVSVRSGARVSMPGMMDTILNVGLCDANIKEWEKRVGERAAWDSYRRLVQMFGSVALGIDSQKFEDQLQVVKNGAEIKNDTELTASHLKFVVEDFKSIVKHETGMEFPQSLDTQLFYAIQAVFESWNNDRAVIYRKLHDYPEDWGTAVTIQSMVFGNMNDQSGSGVLFTRDPSTGEDTIVGEFLPNAQGEDVVAGIRTPLPLSDMDKCFNKGSILDELMTMVGKLEESYRDMQDVEFTVQDGVIYILQTRNGKRSSRAAFQIAYDLFNEGVISRSEMISRVSYKELKILKRPSIDPSFTGSPNIEGIAAGGPVVSGVAVYSVASALKCTEPCILIKEETTPDDIEGMHKAVGILTATGGLTSHAAVVARGMNKTCVVGCTSLHVTSYSATWDQNGKECYGVIPEGTKVTIDGNTGRVWVLTEVPIIPGVLSEAAENLIEQVMQVDDPLLVVNKDVGCADSRLYLYTYPYDMGGTYKQLMEDIKKLSSGCTELIIDLSTPMDNIGADDMEIITMFAEPADSITYVSAKVDAICNAMQGMTKDWVTLVLPFPATLIEANLHLKGIKFVKPANKLKDLIHGGYAQVSSKTIADVFGDTETYNEFLGMMKLAGKSIAAMPLPETKQAYLRRQLS